MSANEPLGAAPAARSGVRFVVGLAIATILGAVTGALLSNDSIGLSIYPLFFCAFAIGCCVPRHAWLCGAIILPIQAIVADAHSDLDLIGAAWVPPVTAVLSVAMAGVSAFGSWCLRRVRRTSAA